MRAPALWIALPTLLLAACATPPTAEETPRTLADANECVTGTNLCRRGAAGSTVQTVSGTAAREVLDRMRPTGTQPTTGGPR
jgi:hypothetical protein